MPPTPITDSELDALFVERDPVDPEALHEAPVAQALARVHAAVIAAPDPAIAAGRLPRRHGVRSRVFRRRVRRPVVLAATVATTAAVTVAVVGSVGLDGGSGGGGLQLRVTPAAAATLNRLARAAAQTNAGLGPHRYEYEEWANSGRAVSSIRGHTFAVRQDYVEQTWQARDGSARQRFVYAKGVPVNAASAQTVAKYHVSMPGGISDGMVPGLGALSDARLPATPRALIAALQAKSRHQMETPIGNRRPKQLSSRPGRDSARALSSSVFADLQQILTDSTSPTLRSAAYRALEYVPGVRLLGIKRDARGRQGVAISFTHGSYLIVLIVDPRDASLLQSSLPDEGDSRTVLVRRAIVSSIDALPGGGRIPYRFRALP